MAQEKSRKFEPVVILANILQIVENKRPDEMSEPFDVSSVMADFFEGRGKPYRCAGHLWSGAVRSASLDGIIKQRQGHREVGAIFRCG